MKVNYSAAIPKLIKAGELQAAFEMCVAYEQEGSCEVDGITIWDDESVEMSHQLSKKVRAEVAKIISSGRANDSTVKLYWDTLLFDARVDFDCYCRYIEKDRPKDKRFYEPRRKQLLPLTQALQRLEYGELDLLAISLPPGVGKTTLAIFFLTWTAGRHPDLQNLSGSHNNEFLRGIYDECLRIFDPNGEYLWGDVFPGLNVCVTNAKNMKIDLGKPKRFPVLQFSSLYTGMAGKVRATNLLYLDDLVEGIEQAMSRDRMEMLWQKYSVDYRQRKQGDRVKELHIATRWSVVDVIGRLEADHENDPRALFINLPALDENGESNFDYPYGLGFTTEMYHDLERSMDDASWRALYLGLPIERQAQLYAPQELRRYFDLPEVEPDAIFAVCDTKEQGDDYCAMPVVYQYGRDFYVDHWVCDNGKPERIMEKIARLAIDKDIQMLRIESNRGGTLFAQTVQKRIEELDGHCRITTKYNTTDKETRIYVASAWIKSHCLFWDESKYGNDKEYRTAMNMLCGYTMTGKNKHDDVPDVLADLENFVRSFGNSHVTLMKRPF